MRRNSTSRISGFRRLWLWVTLLGAAGAVVGLRGYWGGESAVPTVPTAEAKIGEFVDFVELRGEVKARASTIVTAPFNVGDLLILKLCANGSQIRKGDVVVQFDPGSLRRTLDQNRSALKQAEAEIDRLKAQQRLREEQSLTDIIKARYDIERARLDADAYEVLTPIEIEKSRLALAKAEQKLREVEAQIAAARVGAAADMAAGSKRREKAQADLARAERNMEALTLTAPVDGFITLLPNFRARSGMGLSAPVYKEGDRTYAGAEIAELPDLSSIQVRAPIAEADRGRLAVEQRVTMRVDAVPDREHQGRVGEISPLARLDYSSWPIRKNFDLTIYLENPDPRLRPGMSATARVAVERLPDVVLIPVEALFEKNGRVLAYVQTAGGFEERGLEVTRRGDGQAVVTRGVRSGERVALKDPTTHADQE